MIDICHDVNIKRVIDELNSSDKGISENEAKNRLKQYGLNQLDEEKISYFSIFINQFKSPVIYILIFAAILSYFIGDAADFWIILGIIIINSIIGFWQEVKAEASAEALKKLTETKSVVLRDGKKCVIHSSQLVIGDIILLTEGDSIAADIRLTETKNLLVDESTLTGESLPVEKDAKLILKKETLPYELKNMVLSGTIVVKGHATGIVVKTGKNTYLASIAEKASEKSPQSPLTRAMGSFMKKYVIFIFASLFIIGIVDYIKDFNMIDIAYTLIALLVSAIPEGLPIVLTLVLAIGSRILSKKKVLVRHLPAVETLGNATIIVSDKTGTITEGKLGVKKIFTHNESELRHVAALCNESENGKGDPIDVALSKWIGSDFTKVRKQYLQKDIFSFDTTLRIMGTKNVFNNKEFCYIKGAYEIMAKRATNNSTAFLKKHDEFAEEGLRVLAFGICENDDFVNSTIKLIGLIGFVDPPKEGVKDAILVARDAGLRVMMITGDNALTAKTIAREVNIWAKGDLVITGQEIEDMNDEKLSLVLLKTTVIARALPEHKYRVVKLLQEKKEIVAVTGDGVNDVPALKAADLGIAMGSGTEAAKSVSKMILIDNNIKIIISAIKEGRIIADNIRKVIYYLLTSSLSQIFLILGALLMSLPLPLYPLHILWINLVADGVQDKTFPFIKEEGNVMKRKPKNIDNLFFDKHQILKLIISTVIITSVNLILFVYMLNNYSVEVSITVIFTSMVFSQWVNGIHAQKEKEPFFKNVKHSFVINKFIWIGILIGLCLQALAVFVLDKWFKTAPLTLEHFKILAISTILIFLLIELSKWIWYFIEEKNMKSLKKLQRFL